MKNIFKIFKEHKMLLEENKILKAQNEALMQFKKSFDDYYHNISDARIITSNYANKVVLNGVFSLDSEGIYCPIDVCKEEIARKMAKKLAPYIDYDVIDNIPYGTKDLVGRLTVLTK